MFGLCFLGNNGGVLMPNNLLATFGDSWAYGIELQPNEKPFGQIMAEKLGVDFKNYAWWSTSIEHLVFQLRQFIEERPKFDHVTSVFFLTDYSRTLTIEPTQVIEIDVHDPKFKSYYQTVYSDDLGIFKANVIMLALQHICQQYKINDYYICGWTPIEFTLPGIDKNKIFRQGLNTCADILNIPGLLDVPDCFYQQENFYFWPNVCHPNQLGHRHIADTLIKWINK